MEAPIEVVGADVVEAFKAMEDPSERVAFATLLGARADLGRIAAAMERIADALEKVRS